MGKITMADIAERAGVSKAAVSKALRGLPDIGPETTSRIIAVASEMGYRPNNMARSLQTGKSKLIGVLVPNVVTPYYSIVLRGIEATAYKKGYTVVISNTDEANSKEQELLKTMCSIPVDGIISVPIHLENYANLNTPYVFLSRYPYMSTLGIPSAPKDSYVLNDDYTGQRIATTHLIKRGFHNIHLIINSNDATSVQGIKTIIRINGYKQALAAHGIPFCAENISVESNDVTSFYNAAQRILEVSSPPLAFTCTNDVMALGIIHAIAERGLHIPSDVAVIGYDDIELSNHSTPPLTTVHIVKQNMGILATEVLITHIEHPDTPAKQILLDPYIIQRGST